MAVALISLTILLTMASGYVALGLLLLGAIGLAVLFVAKSAADIFDERNLEEKQPTIRLSDTVLDEEEEFDHLQAS